MASSVTLAMENHNLTSRYDFHSYMVRSMKEEFQRIVGVSVPLWGFVVAFLLFDVDGADLYFWLAIIPIVLVLVLGTKLQQIIATLVWENAGVTGFFSETRLRPRDELFWFKKPRFILSLIHFVLFQNAFELATYLWFWVLSVPLLEAVAGVYVGMEYGMERVRGTRDWVLEEKEEKIAPGTLFGTTHIVYCFEKGNESHLHSLHKVCGWCWSTGEKAAAAKRLKAGEVDAIMCDFDEPETLAPTGLHLVGRLKVVLLGD